MVKSAIQGLVMFFGIQFVMGKFMNSGKPTTTTTTDASGTVVTVPANTAEIPPFYARPDHLDEGALYNPLAQRIAPMWPLDSPLDITIVVSPTFVSEPLAKTPKDRIVVDELAFKFGDYKDSRVIDTTFPVPKEVQNNGTLWAHFYIGLTGSKLDPSTPGYNPERAFHFIHPLTQYIAQKKIKKTKNLLAAVNETEEVRFILWDFGRGVDKSVARGRNSRWSDYQFSLSSELYDVFHPGFWSHALSFSPPCR
jgi:Cleft lip and palate transmembrane protein 1 (CLPTM1)